MNIVMAKNKNQRSATEFDENIWKFAEEELENMQSEWIAQEKRTKEKNEERQTEKTEKRPTEKKLEIEGAWKNDKLSQWDLKNKSQDRKDTKDSSTLAEIKTSPSKPQIIRFIMKHNGSQLKVLNVKDISTQVHPNDLDGHSSSKYRHSTHNEASNYPLHTSKHSRFMKILEWVKELSLGETDVLQRVISERRHSKPSSSMKTLDQPTSPPRPERLEEDYNKEERDADIWRRFKTSRERRIGICWNCGSRLHNFNNCDVPKVRLFCYNCGEPGTTRNNCSGCNKLTNFNKTL